VEIMTDLPAPPPALVSSTVICSASLNRRDRLGMAF
jgi:hypothetical protein